MSKNYFCFRAFPVGLDSDDKLVNLLVKIRSLDGALIENKTYLDVQLPPGRTTTQLPAFTPNIKKEGYYVIEYKVTSSLK